jgi:hypothetical protein
MLDIFGPEAKISSKIGSAGTEADFLTCLVVTRVTVPATSNTTTPATIAVFAFVYAINLSAFIL